MKKRWISFVVSIVLLVSMLPVQITGAAEPETRYYVSQESGSDDGTGTEAAPFKSVQKAITKINEAGSDTSYIIIKDNYDLTAADFGAVHTKNVVVEGDSNTIALNIASDLYAGGPFTFQKIKLVYNDSKKDCMIYADGNEVVFGSGVTISGATEGMGWWSFQNMLSTSGAGYKTYDKSHKLTINSGDYYRLYVGNSVITTGAQSIIPGVDFEMNGGYVFQFILGGNGWDGNWGTNSYTDDVNLTFNGGSVGVNGITLAKYGVSNTYFQGGTDFNGHALQIIMNNDNDIPFDAGLTEENVAACHGSLYVLKCAAGSTLETTATAGTYKVNGDMVAVATDGTDTYTSKDGILIVEKAGTYTVTWKNYQASDVAYVSAAGSDDNIGTLSKPFATIEKAIQVLGTSVQEKVTVKIIGSYDLRDADLKATHKNQVLIEGIDGNAKINIRNHVYNTGGNCAFDRITLDYAAADCIMYACGNQLTFGKDMKTTGTGEGWWLYRAHLGTGSYSAGTTHSYQTAHKITVNAGEYYNLFLGDSVIADGQTQEVPGIDFVMNGGLFQNMVIGGNGWDNYWGTNKYTDNVNITVNGGSIHNCVLLSSYCNDFKGSVDFGSHALQFVFNNGTPAALDSGLTAENVSKCNGKLYQLNCEAEAGCYLETTDTAGRYKVAGDKIAKAIDPSTGEVYRSNNGILTVPKEGVYKVSWEKKPDVVYVDAVNGDDANDGTSKDHAVKTLSRAIAASKAPLNPVIKIVNKAVYDSSLTDNEAMTVRLEGYDSNAVFAYGGKDMTLRSNVDIDNLMLFQDGDDLKICTNGYNLSIGSNVTFTHGEYQGLENPVIVTGGAGSYERVVLAGSGCAGLTVGSNGAVSGETRLVIKNTTVDKITVDARNAEAEIKAIADGGQVKAFVIPDDAAFKSIQVIANNGGSILGTTENEKAWYMESDKVAGAKVSLTEDAGTFNATVPAGKVAVAVKENGNSAYVAEDKTAKDEAPKTNYQNTKYTDWGCFTGNGANLVNTYNKLTKDRQLKVAYFGGSLTNGYGCGQPGDPNGTIADGIDRNLYSWRALSGKWLKDHFPQADITTVDAAIGESGTYLGVYRVQDDIIKNEPNLLFVEYAINDDYFAQSNKQTADVAYKQAALQFETIVREVKEALPECDIVVVLTTDNQKLSDTYSGKLFTTAQAHYDIARAYGLPVVNIGLGLAKGIAEAENHTSWWNDPTILKKYICDIVHPYSTGHYYYYLCMEEFLKNYLLYTELEGSSNSHYCLPTVQSEYLMDGDRTNIFGSEMKSYYADEASNGASFHNGTFVTGTSDTPRVGYYEVQKNGSIAFDFTGTEFTIWSNVDWSNVKESFTYTIDGSEARTLIGSTHAPTIVVSGLSSGTHRIVIKATEYMQIAALFVRDDTKQTVQGTTGEYADYNSMTVTVPAGKYKVYYVETAGELPKPVSEAGKEFAGWKDGEGNLVSADTKLTKGITLTACFKDAENYHVEELEIGGYSSDAPTPEDENYKDWLFVGWYADAECTQIISDKTNVSGKKYARFVRPEVLTVKAQITAETKSGSPSTSMRFVSTVDSLKYRQVGFEIIVNSKKKDVAIKTVYSRIVAKDGGTQINYAPTEFCSASKFFSTVTLTNIPNEQFATMINVKPYWITMDGTKVYGQERDICVNEGIK